MSPQENPDRVCDTAGTSVTFRMESGCFIARFAPNITTEKATEKAGEKSREKSREKNGDEMSEKVSEKISEKIMAQIKTSHAITIQQLAEKNGVTTRTIEKHLQKLQRDNLLKRIGPDKGRHWEMVK